MPLRPNNDSKRSSNKSDSFIGFVFIEVGILLLDLIEILRMHN